MFWLCHTTEHTALQLCFTQFFIDIDSSTTTAHSARAMCEVSWDPKWIWKHLLVREQYRISINNYCRHFVAVVVGVVEVEVQICLAWLQYKPGINSSMFALLAVKKENRPALSIRQRLQNERTGWNYTEYCVWFVVYALIFWYTSVDIYLCVGYHLSLPQLQISIFVFYNLSLYISCLSVSVFN